MRNIYTKARDMGGLMRGTLLALAVVCLAMENAIVDGECLSIVSRDHWRARPPKTVATATKKPVHLVVVHHAASNSCEEPEGCMKLVRGFQNFHMDDRNWDDIGYNFLIGEDGNIYEGRGWQRVGAHSLGYNWQSLGICIIGNFMERPPNDKALEKLKKFLEYATRIGYVSANYQLVGHRQTRDTLCPGDHLYDIIKDWDHWVSDPGPKHDPPKN